jgi:hypothetical protein
MMNKKATILFALLTLAFSCQDEDREIITACGVENPAKNLPWMNAMIDSWNRFGFGPYSYIVQGDYLGQTVFIPGSCCPFCLELPPPVLDCEGKVLWNTAEDPEKTDLITDTKVIWKSVLSKCNFN